MTAVAAWRVQLNVLARRTAWEYIVGQQMQTGYVDVVSRAARALAHKKKRADWEEFAARWSQNNLSEDEEKRTTPIFDWLNREEFVAITILNGSMHAPTYAEWWGVEFIHGWKRAEGFVEALRKTDRGDLDLYSKIERLANSAKFRKLCRWEELTGDEALG